ncbi:MAG: hypothetical protein JWM98_1757 [Thermoleophilia bacterium]|nr:hypothetical protein [Thermoleophilia bacterium]
MGIALGWKVAGVAALGIGAAAALAGCAGGGSKKGTGPMAELTDDVFSKLHPQAFRGARQLSLATDSKHPELRDDGTLQGTYDGTLLLQAADSHKYGTPQVTDPVLDVKGDGTATWNEVREVVRHYDADASGAFDADESRAYGAGDGLRWVPAPAG